MRSLFEWLDTHPDVYWLGAAAATLALLASMATGFRMPARSDKPALLSEWVFAGLLFLFLLAWRWPYLFCASEYNPDESQFIAGAMALTRDPVFWRAVDGVTSGPLDFYVLLPLHWLGLPLDYFGARVNALVLTWLTLLLVYRTFRAEAPRAVARLALLPGAIFFAAASAPDFVHYSSEITPIALLALAVCLGGRRPMAAVFVAGCLPWAKLQAAPLAVAVVGWHLGQAWRSRTGGAWPWRRGVLLLASAAAPTLVVLVLVAAFGQMEHFYRRFILQNIAYVGGGLPVDTVMRDMLRFARESGHFFPWLWASILFLVAGSVIHLRQRIRAPHRAARPTLPALFWLAAILTGTAAFCIATPSRSTLHYLFFLTVPLTLWTGALLGRLWRLESARWPVAAVALACALAPLAARTRQPTPHMLGQLTDHWRRPYTQLGQVIRYWHEPGARLALWGWMSFAFVEGGLPQATRDTVSQWCILDVPQRNYYRATFLADMRRNQPELFVDAVGPGAPFFYVRATQAHEIDPDLAEYVRRHYRLVVDLQHARVYVRNDFLEKHPLPASELKRLVGRGRIAYGEPVEANATKPAKLPENWLNGQRVRMIEPPAEMTWLLEGTERSIRLDFGMHPKAYTEGSTDGAEFIAELHMPAQPPLQVFHRLLEPARSMDHRGPQSADVDLPPYPAGTSLVIRTTAGNAGDSAWDWVYLGGVRFSHSPFYSVRQFPGFRRVPNRVDSPYPYLVHHDAEWLLMLPPPSALTFVLDGNERQLNFAYGLQEESYTGQGQTDGAVYKVDLLRDGAEPRNIFLRDLKPLSSAEDRGRQYADLILPADIKPGDRVVLTIDPGAGTSWDWTYLAALDLR